MWHAVQAQLVRVDGPPLEPLAGVRRQVAHVGALGDTAQLRVDLALDRLSAHHALDEDILLRAGEGGGCGEGARWRQAAALASRARQRRKAAEREHWRQRGARGSGGARQRTAGFGAVSDDMVLGGHAAQSLSTVSRAGRGSSGLQFRPKHNKAPSLSISSKRRGRSISGLRPKNQRAEGGIYARAREIQVRVRVRWSPRRDRRRCRRSRSLPWPSTPCSPTRRAGAGAACPPWCA